MLRKILFAEVGSVRGIILCAIGYLVVMFPPTIYGQETGHGVMWDANTETHLAGYKLHYGTVSGNYTETIDVGNVTEHLFFTNPAITDGLYHFAATAYDTSDKESPYSTELYITIDVTAETTPVDGILDNDTQWTKAIGTWKTATDSGFYGVDSKFSSEPGAKYIFEASEISGAKEISMQWSVTPRRCPATSIEIYDNSTLLDIINVNQQENGGQWNSLGIYTFSDTARLIINSQGGCSTCADAVMIANVLLSTPQQFRISGTIILTPFSPLTTLTGSGYQYLQDRRIP